MMEHSDQSEPGRPNLTISDVMSTLPASSMLVFDIDTAASCPPVGERGEPDDVEIFREGEIIPNFTYLHSPQLGNYAQSSNQEGLNIEPRPTGNFSLSVAAQVVEIHGPRKVVARVPERPQSHGLCALCTSVDFWAFKTGVQHHRYVDLQQYADKCDFCAMLADSVLEPENFVPSLDKPVMLYGTGDEGSESINKLQVRYPSIENSQVGSGSGNTGVRCTDLDIFVDNDNPYQYYFSGRSVGSADDPAQIHRWLNDCVTSHASCGQDSVKRGIPPAHEAPFLPKRVINVGGNDTNVEPFLFESDGSRAQYLALSHRWGDADMQKTTLADLEEKKSEICFDSLCKTFQDAIIMTRKLGFQYIWIDALCIVQDSVVDWREQASNMSNIYLSATITLSASVATSGNSGLIYPRENPRIIQLPLRVSNPEDYPSLKYSVSTRYLSSFEDDVVKGTLSKRAWCLQEQILPLRIVYFGHDQLHWECLTTTLSESSKTEVNVVGIAQEMRKMFARSDTDWEQQRSVLVQNKLPEDGWLKQIYGRGHYGTWYRMVVDYSSREITKDTDRLPALGGLAQTWARRTRENYACGLWGDDLAAGLLWSGSSFHEPYGTRSHLRRPPERTAPSWSWISFDGPIQYPLGKLGPVDIERPWFVGAADPQSLSSIGSPGPAFIRITGRVRPLVTMHSFSQPLLAHIAHNHQNFVPDKIPRIAWDEDGKYDFRQLWCLLIAFRGCGSKTCSHSAGCKLGFAYAVVLWPNPETGCCKRVGIAQTFQSDWEGVQRDTITLE